MIKRDYIVHLVHQTNSCCIAILLIAFHANQIIPAAKRVRLESLGRILEAAGYVFSSYALYRPSYFQLTLF
jgi:hypothetical protein